MSETPAPNYEAVLNDLRAQRDRLDAAIRALEALVPEPAPGAYRGMSLLAASKKVLETKGKCQRTRDILRALQEGGVALSGKSPINTVGAILNTQVKKGGDIVRVRRGVWSLARWQAPAEDADRPPAHQPSPSLKPSITAVPVTMVPRMPRRQA